ncbi:3-dehydroquinate synthase [Hazenella coriacea]|uniref:3-dehydroquinate synthase n=1 Tax=Hazenella coriacea TaxID=1179467 RepID=A0A4R3L1F1_9BACL|nr:3-dehydroquinate synthase [Hazenella coriacea]TCS93391.1 3-dehydroquinate synthase [Hazenella coriacea]
MRTLSVSLAQHSYPIHIGSSIYPKLPYLLTEVGVSTKRSLMIISDSQVAPLYLNQVQSILEQAGYRIGTAIFPAGEKKKNLQQVEELIEQCYHWGLDRQSVIVALGGGVVGDLAGFVAATYMRGISFVQLPTTLLAHDSSVGGKVGVNHRLGKNMIGAFHQPLMVVFDVDTLTTLPRRQLISGYAEVIKHGLIWDRTFVQWLAMRAEPLLSLDRASVIEAIERGCQVKATVVAQDEKELGIRAVLNYGHTIGHALEAISFYQQYTHGEAIAIGMAGAARLSRQVLGAHASLVEQTEALLRSFQLPTRFEQDWDETEFIQRMTQDKKARGGKLTFILSKQLGNVEIVRDVDAVMVKNVLREIRRGSC